MNKLSFKQPSVKRLTCKQLPSIQKGMTIVEIMVAITISLVLLSGVAQIFLSSKQSYRMNEELARLQENGRIVLDLLSQDVRMIGYQGCADPEDIPATIVANNAPTSDLASTALGGAKVGNLAWDPIAPSELPTTLTDTNGNNYTLANLPLEGTDVIITQFASAVDAQTTNAASPITGDIQIPQNPGNFAANDVLAIADCDSVDIFRVSDVGTSGSDILIRHAATHNSTANLSKAYATGARVYRVESNVYFVAPARHADGSVKTNNRGATINALYRADIDANLISIVEGVDNLQVLYGQRLTTGYLQYLSADDGSLNMQNVDSIKVGVLMSTIDAISEQDDSNTYTVAGTDIDPEGTAGATVTYPIDRRVRRVYTETINLRNRQ
ncbi:MAG: PilW family protein [Gammaproteobacteria bacterium]